MGSNKFKVGDKVKYTWEYGAEIGTITQIIDDNSVQISCKDDYSDRIFCANIKYLEHLDCAHKWIDVGFNFTKDVCYYCNKEK